MHRGFKTHIYEEPLTKFHAERGHKNQGRYSKKI